MANGRSNFGFNVTGGGGGLANLVQAPRVTPARTLQFAPTPRPRIERDEKDPKKQILGALLGAASPYLADQALEKLGDFTNLNLFEEDPTATAAQLDFEKAKELPDVVASTEGLKSLLRQKRLAEIDKFAPQIKAPERKTLLGNILSSALQYSPGLLLADDDDGGVASFISAAGSGRKLADALTTAERAAAIKRSETRAAAASKVDPKFTQVKLYGYTTVNGQIVGYETTGVRDEEGNVWARSRGSDLDKDQTTGDKVERGKLYRNPAILLRDGDLGAVEFKTGQSSGGKYDGNLYEFRIEQLQDPETGARVLRATTQDPENRSKTATLDELNQRGFNITFATDLTSARQSPTRVPTETQQAIDGAAEQQALIKDVSLLAEQIIGRLGGDNLTFNEETGKFEGLDKTLKAGTKEFAATIADIFERNVTAISEIVRKQIPGAEGRSNTELFDLFINNKADPNGVSKPLFNELTQYQTALQSEDEDLIRGKRNTLVSRLLQLRENADLSDEEIEKVTGGEKSFLNMSEAELQQYLLDNKFYGAGMIRLAYLLAAADGEKGRSLSDKDVALRLQTIGFTDGSPYIPVENILANVYTQIQKYDGKDNKTQRLTKIEQSTGDEKARAIIEELSTTSGQLGLDYDDLKKLRESDNPEATLEIYELVRRSLDQNTAGRGGTLVEYDPDLQMYLPFTFSRNFKTLFPRLNRYFTIYGYDIATGRYAPRRQKDNQQQTDTAPVIPTGLSSDNPFVESTLDILEQSRQRAAGQGKQ